MACAAWCATRRDCKAGRGGTRSKSSKATCCGPIRSPMPCSGIAVAYYLVHSLGAGADFSERDAQAARNFGAAAKSAGVERIIYLGGLGDPATALSAHLRSRQQTGEALREGGVPVTEFRAGVIVGSGSLSFEMIRYLTERVPVMICPRWVYTRIQPIAVRNVLDYLVEALRVPESAGQVIEIGGADVISYGEMLTFYAEVRGLRRWLIPVPVLTPKLSSYWVHFVTPIPAVDRATARRRAAQRDHRARRLRAAPFSGDPAARLSDCREIGAGKTRRPCGRERVERRALDQPARRPARHANHTRRHDHRAPPGGRRCFARFGVSGLQRDRRRARMALPELDVAHPRRDRPALWWSGHAAWPARCR